MRADARAEVDTRQAEVEAARAHSRDQAKQLSEMFAMLQVGSCFLEHLCTCMHACNCCLACSWTSNCSRCMQWSMHARSADNMSKIMTSS